MEGIKNSDQKLREQPEPNVKFFHRPFLKQWYGRVAIIVLSIGFGFMFRELIISPKNAIIITKYGEKNQIRLPDGSLVHLNGNTRIEYSSHWSADEPRIVRLQGEAYFSVTHKNNNQKFWVLTSDKIKIEVIGTEFNVHSRQTTSVALSSGKVRLEVKGDSDEAQSIIMKPGDVVELSEKSDAIVQKKIKAAVLTSWKSDKLLFDSTSVKEIFDLIHDTYGYQVNLHDKAILQQYITGSVPNKNLDAMLDGLEYLLNVKTTKSDNIIYIQAKL